MKIIKDGWHRVYNYSVYTENSCVLYGVKGEKITRETLYPYCYDPGQQAFVNCSGIHYENFRSRLRRGTVCMR